MSNKILVATRSFGSTSSKPWDVLDQEGCEIVKADMSQKITEERLIELLKGVDGAIIGVLPMTAHVIQNSPNLKVVSMHGVGVDHIDLTAAANSGVVIANCQGVNDQSVADLTIGLMISIEFLEEKEARLHNVIREEENERKRILGQVYSLILSWRKERLASDPALNTSDEQRKQILNRGLATGLI